MSQIGLNYDARTDPSPLTITARIEAQDNAIHARLLGVDLNRFVLTPTGDLDEQIMSTVAVPIAQTISDWMQDQVVNLVTHYGPFPIATVAPFVQSLDDQQLTITPSQLRVSSWNGMLRIDCDVHVG